LELELRVQQLVPIPDEDDHVVVTKSNQVAVFIMLAHPVRPGVAIELTGALLQTAARLTAYVLVPISSLADQLCQRSFPEYCA